MDEKEWRQGLPPVLVVRADEVPAVPFSLALPDLQAGRAHRWVLTAEDGAKLSGEFLPDTLRNLGNRNFGGVEFQRGELDLPLLTQPGYFRLEVEQPGRESLPETAMSLIVTPLCCYQPAAVNGERHVWGPTVPLFALRSDRNWGIGDFSDLRTLVDLTADAGGGLVGLTPLHALFPDDPLRPSPYIPNAPSSRCFGNVLYLDVEAVAEFDECPAARQLVASTPFQTRLRRLRAGDAVDYAAVSAAKREVLSLLYSHFRDAHLKNDTSRAHSFRLFREAGGELLECHGRFEALQQHFQRHTPSVRGWPDWPEDYRHSAAPTVAAFAAAHAEEVEFFVWLQWLTELQLAAAGHQAWHRGLGLGLCPDLAPGANPGGSEAWAWQDVLTDGAFSPLPLRQVAYGPFIALLRANMRHAGALRMDPVPLQEDLLGILALESQRNQCMVIGENLGPLPEAAASPFVVAIHGALVETTSRILLVPPADIAGVMEKPNWRRRLPLRLEDWRQDARLASLFETLRRKYGSAVDPHANGPAARRAIIPRATYRLQFNLDFTFKQAAALAAYLAELGVSHCYASSYLKARPGSRHGYDVVDHAALNPEIGSAEDYAVFVAALKASGLGQILDVVPNHMGVMGADNAWWLDVLENGPASAKGNFFDIDWEPLNPELRGKVLLPLLGDHYGTVLNRGELRLDYEPARGEFSIFYFQHRLPVDPATYPRIVGHRIERLARVLGAKHPRYLELQSLLAAFGHLPDRNDVLRMAERQQDKEALKGQLITLCANCAPIAGLIAENLAQFNGRANDAGSFDLLHELIQFQGYRLACWRVASDEVNYRRFFDINDLAGLRMEDPAVFAATHRFVLDLLAQGTLDGLRIDHADGLYDPAQYFRRLQQAVDGKAPVPGEALPLYLLIEKILADHERLPDDWQIHGGTGYRFSNLVNNLFVDDAAEPRMTRIYQDFTGLFEDFAALAYGAKTLIMRTALASELNVLANRLARIAAANRDTCDFTLGRLREALTEISASFPVYRSYVADEHLSLDDRRHIAWAVALARKHSPAADTSIYGFIQDVLTTDIAHGRSASFRERVHNFAMKFQQFSAPVMAKGVEDTAFYRYHRLSSLNDVGGDPRRFGISVAAFHAATRQRAAHWPHGMLATSTHDSKRSEDVRARLNVLSEMPEKWDGMLQRWSRLNRSHKSSVDEVDGTKGVEAPSRNDEVLLYQTLIGTWPLVLPDDAGLADYRTRIEAYMIKALREAKEHSNWINVNTDYETAMSRFVEALLAPGENNLFLADFVPQVQPIAHFGLQNSLAQTLIKLTSPGVPDIYQGCELWQFNLVDPDNRRPVDFVCRQTLLAEVKALLDAPPAQWPLLLRPLLADMSDSRIKLYVLWRSLALRGRWPEVFRDGDYLPLSVTGEGAEHVCAFARRYGKRALIALVPRLTVGLLRERTLLPLGPEIWGDTAVELPGELADCPWTNVLTGEEHRAAGSLPVAGLLACFPVALLAGEASA